MSITGLELISSIPRKNGKISVLLEIDRSKENIRALTELYGERLSLSQATLPEIEDKFNLLIEIRNRCQQIQNLILTELDPMAVKKEPDFTDKLIAEVSDPAWKGEFEGEEETIAMLDAIKVPAEPLVAPDEFEPTHVANILTFPNEASAKDYMATHNEFQAIAPPANEFYGDKED